MQKNYLPKGETVEEGFAKVAKRFQHPAKKAQGHQNYTKKITIFAPKMQKLICQKGIAFKKCSL